MDGYGLCYRMGMSITKVMMKKFKRFLCVILLVILCAHIVNI